MDGGGLWVTVLCSSDRAFPDFVGRQDSTGLLPLIQWMSIHSKLGGISVLMVPRNGLILR